MMAAFIGGVAGVCVMPVIVGRMEPARKRQFAIRPIALARPND
jgi:hypothetical protein